MRAEDGQGGRRPAARGGHGGVDLHLDAQGGGQFVFEDVRGDQTGRIQDV